MKTIFWINVFALIFCTTIILLRFLISIPPNWTTVIMAFFEGMISMFVIEDILHMDEVK